MKQFSLKQIEEIANKSGLKMEKGTGNVFAILLPTIVGIVFTDDFLSRTVIYFECSEFHKEMNKRKYIITDAYDKLIKQRYSICFETAVSPALRWDDNTIKNNAEKDPIKFCKYMLQKTINKAKLLKRNEIKKAGAKYDIA